MFSNLQIRPAKPHGRKSSMAARSGISKRRISHAFTSPNEVPSVSFMENLFGEEFPEAFVDGVGRRTSRSRKSIMDLPAEILALVGDNLSKMDLKRLRLANQYLAAHVNLRIDRVYISPNRANLHHLRRILDHPQYKYQVREIVWDEALLDHYPDLNSFRDALEDDAIQDRRELEKLFACAILGHDDASAEYRTFEIDDFFEDGRLTEAGKSILLQQDGPFSRKILALNATILMTVEDSYDFYQALYRQQQDIICQNMDSEALLQALNGFPNVHRVTVTSEVWRMWHINPIYDTPFHRSLPPGLQKPTVYPWLEAQPLWRHRTGRTRSIHNHGPIELSRNPELGHEWHGYKTVIAALSKNHFPGITEFIVDSGHEHTGIGHHLFAAPNKDFDLTIGMADHLSLKRLDFSINSFYLTNGREDDYLTSGYLKTMFQHMPHLEHLDFNPHCIQRNPSKQSIFEKTIEFEHVFPLEMLRRLKSFTLRNAHIRSDQLLDLIASLHTAERITLDNISTGNILMLIKSDWSSFFMHLYTHYERALSISHNSGIPRFTFILPQSSHLYGTARCQLIDEELDAFLSGRASLPFSDRHLIHKNAGWIIDDRDPGFKIRPSAEYWAAEEDYMRRQAANDPERYSYDEELEWQR